jgi:hypothetical protein
MTKNGSRQLNALLALALWGGCVTGVLGFVVGVLALLNGNLLAAAVAITGAGVVFGLLSKALLR